MLSFDIRRLHIVLSAILAAIALFASSSNIAAARQLYPHGKVQQIMIKYSSGTGFFVSRSGHIITNAHVLKSCKSVKITGKGIKDSTARIIHKDPELDLALIKTQTRPRRVAYIREQMTEPRKGDRLMVLGYPGNRPVKGEYTVEYSKVVDLKGPMGDDKWVQFESVSQRGNSGGPLLDFAGNVIGVVTAKVDLYRENLLAATKEKISSSDVAVKQSVLINYLKKHGVYYYSRDSLMQLSKRRMERVASEFTVNILCETGREVVTIDHR